MVYEGTLRGTKSRKYYEISRFDSVSYIQKKHPNKILDRIQTAFTTTPSKLCFDDEQKSTFTFIILRLTPKLYG